MTYSLGLQDCHGAISRDRIDLSTQQIVVDRAVEHNIHEAIPEPDEDAYAQMPDPHSRCCHNLLGCCKQDAACHVAEHFANHLAKKVRELHLSTGTLVTLHIVLKDLKDSAASASGSASSEAASGAFFLGMLCQRPLLHVLVKAWSKAGNKFSVTAEAEGVAGPAVLPEFFTSFQVFRSLAMEVPHVDDWGTFSVQVRVLSHSFERTLWNMRDLDVKVSSIFTEFLLPSVAVAAAGPRIQEDSVELPFGLKLVPKKRKPRSKAKSKGGQHKGRGKGGSKHGARKRGRPSHPSEAEDGSEVDDSSSSSSSDNDSSGCEDVACPTDTATHKTAAVAEAESEFVQVQADTAAILHSRSHTGSYFVKSVGFDEGSIAPTGRSSCYHCNAKIGKGSARFSYFWSTQRPSRYMRSSCAVKFIQADPETRKQQAISAMQRIAQNATAADIKSAAEGVLSMLEGGAAASA